MLMSPNFDNILSEMHEELSSIFLILIGLHVMGVLVDSLLGRENLVRALWAGIKRVPAKEPEGDALESSVW